MIRFGLAASEDDVGIGDIGDWLIGWVNAIEFLVVLGGCELGEVGLGRDERASGVLVVLVIVEVFAATTMLRHTTHTWIVITSHH